jgi:hypothetical protein
MTGQELETVVLDRDVPIYGLRQGDLGAVVHVREPDALEVEFVLASGRTHALVTLLRSEVRGFGDQDLPAVRTLPDRDDGTRTQPRYLHDRAG